VPDVQQIEAAVGERDFIAGGAPVRNSAPQAFAIENLDRAQYTLRPLRDLCGLSGQKPLTAEFAEKSRRGRGENREPTF
jgi:hypothetical protein